MTIAVNPVSQPSASGLIAYQVRMDYGDDGQWSGIVSHNPEHGSLRLLETIAKAAGR